MDAAVAVVFIHGLAKKPPPERLREIWLESLGRDNPMPTVFPPPNAGLSLGDAGIHDRFVYYADLFYGIDYQTDLSAYYERSGPGELVAEGLDQVEPGLPTPIPATSHEAAFLVGFEAKLQGAAAVLPSAPPVGEQGLEIASWLPDAVKQAIIKKAAMEAYYYLFDKPFPCPGRPPQPMRQAIRSLLLDTLQETSRQADKLLVVAHSMGTMVAYDVLRNCPECPVVDTLITLGSPLGIEEVQDELKAPDVDRIDFPAARLGRWINLYDPLDPVCGADPRLSNDYAVVDGKGVLDVRESNWGNWRHTITHYLAGARLRDELRHAAGLH